MRRNQAIIGLVAILDVAMLVATSQSVAPVTGRGDLGEILLSPESPELEIEPVVTLGEGFGDTEAFTVSFALSVENLGGNGWLMVYDLPDDWDGVTLPDSPAATHEVRDPSTGPFSFQPVLSFDVDRAALDGLHLLVVLDGDAELEGTGELLVTYENASPSDEDLSISVEIP